MPSARAFFAVIASAYVLLKPNGIADLQAARCEPAVQLVERRIALALQQLANDRSGVLGVEIDRARRQRLLEDSGVAEAGLVHGRPARGDERLGEDLAQDVRLGESLRPDDERRRSGGDLRRLDEAGEREHADPDPT